MWPQRLVLAYLGFGKAAASTPQPGDSSFEIIFSNDLLGMQSEASNAALLLARPVTQKAASVACAELHESLADPRDYPAPSTLQSLLSQRSEPSRTQSYWINSSGGNCRTINAAGEVAVTPCNYKLPALCTQAAPFSNSTYTDNSPKWRVQTEFDNQAVITGYRDRVGFRFLGVRYAEQPKRFTYSTLSNKPGNQSAISYGSECNQVNNIGGSEDCLFLNIFTTTLPRTNAETPAIQLKPVMFYIHGGGLVTGAGSIAEYDGGNLASRGDVVVVTINYRLGPFGFLALDDHSTNGNFGLSDQINALDWVRTNIASFGGDPTRITLFGQSAGAISVTALLGSPAAVGKFAAAMPLSSLGGLGPVSNFVNYPSISTVAELSKPLLETTGCFNATSQVECLRALSASEIATKGPSTAYLTLDGTYVNSSRLALDRSAYVANVHLLLGIMHDEAAALITYPNATTNVTQALSVDGFNAALYQEALFPVASGQNETLNVFNATTHFSTDAMIRCYSQAIAHAGAENRVFKSVWYYEYERAYQVANFDINAPVCDAPITAEHPYGDTSLPFFRCHGGDVYYVFGNLIRSGKHARDNVDIPFSQLIVDSYTAFARSYTPNPSFSYLRNRNYASTLKQVQAADGIWQPVTSRGKPVRVLDWPSKQGGYRDLSQCEALGLPLDFMV